MMLVLVRMYFVNEAHLAQATESIPIYMTISSKLYYYIMNIVLKVLTITST